MFEIALNQMSLKFFIVFKQKSFYIFIQFFQGLIT